MQWRSELIQATRIPYNASAQGKLRKRISNYEDKGHGSCWLNMPMIAEITERAILQFDDKWYRLLEWCIMPNHVHVLIETIAGYSISQIIRQWKSHTARESNRILARTGAFWMADYFDRFVRDEDHLKTVANYIRNNPVKAGLIATAEQWRFSSAWSGRQSQTRSEREDFK